ncbi:MAG: hypothetical protein SF052_10180 [Bacteroidia bacterium]|nr:hypothetical protein [Bacteroidia bacterium]
MKRNHFFLLAFLLCGTLSLSAQPDFNNCAAAFLGQKRMVNEYTTTGFCEVNQSEKGLLSVCQISLNEDGDIKGRETEFMVAIRDGATQTYWMFSAESYKKIAIEKILSRCKPGDKIVLMTRDREWALPHAEITVK